MQTEPQVEQQASDAAAPPANDAAAVLDKVSDLSWWQENAPHLIETYLIPTVGVLVFFFIAWLIASFLGRVVGSGMERAKVDKTLSRFVSRGIRWTILLFAILGCLGYFGINVTAFAAVIGAAGLAIGLAFQGSLANVAAGVMLLIFRPFRVDQVVSVAGTLGKVYEIELFTTAIDTFDNRRIIVPNSQIFGSTVENYLIIPSAASTSTSVRSIEPTSIARARFLRPPPGASPVSSRRTPPR